MTAPRVCPVCGADVPADSPAGLCPRCLLVAGLESDGTAPRAAAIGPHETPTVRSPAAGGGFVPPTPDELAASFPQLEVLELLGKGGMGAVYKARQPGLDRFVAIKILPPEISHAPSFAERFVREARALARLSHPNIVSVYDFGQTDGLCWFLMEYVDGANLRQVIQSREMSPEEALCVVPQICDALQYAHDEGVVHRDIKPENILVDQRGRVKIADFGLAKLLGADQPDHSLTATHQVMGTLRYMAPEQMEGSKRIDHRADIYSLGVVFYELLTGELPMGRFAPPSRKVAVDVRIDEVVLRALEKEPEQRWQHASDVKTEVDAIRGSSGARAVSPSRPSREELERVVVSLWPDKIAAIRAYRDKARTGLFEAKRAVETIAALHGLVDRRQTLRGRAAIVTIICAGTAVASWVLAGVLVSTWLAVMLALAALGSLVAFWIGWRVHDRALEARLSPPGLSPGTAPRVLIQPLLPAAGRCLLLAATLAAFGVFGYTSLQGKQDDAGQHLLVTIGAFDPWFTLDRLGAAPKAESGPPQTWTGYKSTRQIHWLSWSMLAGVIAWICGVAFYRTAWKGDRSQVAAWWNSLSSMIRDPVKTVLSLVIVAGFIWVVSFSGRSSQTAEGETHRVEIGALDPWFVHEKHPLGFHSAIQFLSLSAIVGYISAVALWLVIVIARAETAAQPPAGPVEKVELEARLRRRRRWWLSAAILFTVGVIVFLIWCLEPAAMAVNGPDTMLLEFGARWKLGSTVDGILFRLLLIGGPILIASVVSWVFSIRTMEVERVDLPPEARLVAPAICGIVAAAIGMLIWLPLLIHFSSEARLAVPKPVAVLLATAFFTMSCVALAGFIAMLQVRNLGLATAGTIVSTIPTHIGWLLGLPVGIWALRVLAREDVRELFRRQAEGDGEPMPANATAAVQTADVAIRSAGSWLFATGVATLLVWIPVVLVWFGLEERLRPRVGLEFFGMAAGIVIWWSLIAGTAITRAGMNLRRHEGPTLSRVGAILAMIPLSPAVLIGLPAGIRCLRLLSRPDVKAAFAAKVQEREAARRAASSEESVAYALGWLVGFYLGGPLGIVRLATIVLCLVGVVDTFGVWEEISVVVHIQKEGGARLDGPIATMRPRGYEVWQGIACGALFLGIAGTHIVTWPRRGPALARGATTAALAAVALAIALSFLSDPPIPRTSPELRAASREIFPYLPDHPPTADDRLHLQTLSRIYDIVLASGPQGGGAIISAVLAALVVLIALIEVQQALRRANGGTARATDRNLP